jgi:MFS family permease
VAAAPDRKPQGFVVTSPDDGTPIDLRNPFLAAVLSWLVPGLGQCYQRRTTKGGLFMGTLLAALVIGLWVGGGRVVYASWRGGESRLAFLGQAGIGVVAIPAVIQSLRLHGDGKEPLAGGWFAPPLKPGQLVSTAYAARLMRSEPGVDAEDFFDKPPYKQFRGDQLSMWQRRLGRRFDVGTLYTVLAGMLNVLVVLDAFAGPMRAPPESRPQAAAPERESLQGKGT